MGQISDLPEVSALKLGFISPHAPFPVRYFVHSVLTLLSHVMTTVNWKIRQNRILPMDDTGFYWVPIYRSSYYRGTNPQGSMVHEKKVGCLWHHFYFLSSSTEKWQFRIGEERVGHALQKCLIQILLLSCGYKWYIHGIPTPLWQKISNNSKGSRYKMGKNSGPLKITCILIAFIPTDRQQRDKLLKDCGDIPTTWTCFLWHLFLIT